MWHTTQFDVDPISCFVGYDSWGTCDRLQADFGLISWFACLWFLGSTTSFWLEVGASCTYFKEFNEPRWAHFTKVDSGLISCFVLCSDAWAGWAHFTTIDFGPISCFKVSKLPRPVMLRFCPQRSGKSGKSGPYMQKLMEFKSSISITFYHFLSDFYHFLSDFYKLSITFYQMSITFYHFLSESSNFSKVVFGTSPCFVLCSDTWGGWTHFRRMNTLSKSWFWPESIFYYRADQVHVLVMWLSLVWRHILHQLISAQFHVRFPWRLLGRCHILHKLMLAQFHLLFFVTILGVAVTSYKSWLRPNFIVCSGWFLG